MKSSNLDSQHYYDATKVATQAEKSALLLKFFRTAIAERESGYMSLWEVGNQTLSLTFGINIPKAELHSSKLEPQFAVLNMLIGVASGLDMAEQGGTSRDADEKLWQEYKQLVDEYEISLNG